MSQELLNLLIRHRSVPARREFDRPARTAEHTFFRRLRDSYKLGNWSACSRDYNFVSTLYDLEKTRKVGLRLMDVIVILNHSY